MPGPKTAAEARKWVRSAVADGRYVPSTHFLGRLIKRGILLTDVQCAIGRCRHVEPYSGMPLNGGSCWRFFGSNVDGTMEIAVGIEAYVGDDGQEMIILCTALPGRKAMTTEFPKPP